MFSSANALVTLATCAMSTPFFILANNLSEATSKPPVTAIQPDLDNKEHSSGVNVFSNLMFVHQVI